MTKKDYIVIAKIMNQNQLPAEYNRLHWQNICRDLARAMAKDNPRFDRQKFLTACGFSS